MSVFRYWLFGEKTQNAIANGTVQRIRGWFPRRCAVEIVDCDDAGQKYVKEKKTN